MSELDKFKRRLVRSVSHLLKQDQRMQETAWEQMQKETGCDCKLLWDRMRALTIKKLKRLVASDDRSDSVAAVARLSTTDWLLFDLVLVHENIDVIGRELIGRAKGQVERSTMLELVELVQKYGVELKTGDALLEAWTALTRDYNRDGRQCSPLLLQKRWFQLKELTRTSFYKLWNNYRGNQKLWDAAAASKPTPLQSFIAKKFPQVITQPFPDWQELVRMKKVVLLEQFETQQRMKNRPITADDKPDLVMIEPVIETIDVGEESDGDNPTTSTANTSNEVNLALVKQEPSDDCKEVTEQVEDGLSNVQILETTHVSPELNEDTNSNTPLCSLALDKVNQLDEVEKLNEQMSSFMETPTLEDVCESAVQNEITEVDDIDLADDLIKQKADEYIKSKAKPLEQETEKTPIDEGDDEEKIDDIVDDIIKQKADDFVRKVDIKKLVNDVVDEFKLPENLAFEDEGMEFVDDGIEYVEDDDNESAEKLEEKEVLNPVNKTEVIEEKIEEEHGDLKEKDKNVDCKEEGNPKFDLKLLMEPVVYTTKLDNMIVFKGKKFDFVQLQNIIDSVVIESKPVSKNAIKVEAEEDVLGHTNLSQSSKAASDDLFNDTEKEFQVKSENLSDKDTDVVNNKALIDNLNQTSNDSDDSEEEIDESLKVKASSCLLQKPRNRSYNPIILCKNPDFNTRLKRLTVGFFSSERNRRLLSACKPMTIDVNKAFESKLVNGTLYLKSSEGTPKPIEEPQTDNAQSSSVLPSAMPVQSLLSKENNNVNINELLSSTQIDTVDLTQRSKTINLRNLSEIRRINQHLLTAQVPPMRVDSGHVNNLPTCHPEEIAKDDGTKPIDNSDELKIISVAGRQDVSQNTSAPDQDCNKLIESYRGRGRGRGRGVTRGGIGRKFWPAKPYVPFTPTKPSSVPTWLKGAPLRPGNIDDFLITIDTLNRMINKLNGYEEHKNFKGKKKTNWVVEKDVQASANLNSNSNDAVLVDSAAATQDVVPVENVSETAVNVSVQTAEAKSKPPPKKRQRRRGKVSYCCWSKEKLMKYGTRYKVVSIHLCKSICQCCCRLDLIEEIKRRRNTETKHQEVQTSIADSIELSDEDNDSNDVRIPGFDPVEDTMPVPKVTVISQDSNAPCRSYGRGTPMSLTAVKPIQEQTTFPAPSPLQQPVMRINVTYGPPTDSSMQDTTLSNTPKAPPSVLQHLLCTSKPDPAIPLLTLDSTPNKVKHPSIRTSQRKIVIDASEGVNEKMFYLNSKSISSKPKDSPIFLGKNKILLTNVKFPPDLVSEDTNTNEPIQPSKVIPTMLPLPAGVNLILMPDGKLNYTIDPTVQLDAAQLESLPTIISAVQEQINTHLVAAKETTAEINTIAMLNDTAGGSKLVIPVNQEATGNKSIETVQQIEDSNAKEPNSSSSVDQATNYTGKESSESRKNNTTDKPSPTKSVTINLNNDSEANKSNYSEIITIDENDEPEMTDISPNTNNSVNEGASSSRNLLSDLMEMSGISSDDVVQESAGKITPEIPPPLVSSVNPVTQVPPPVGSVNTQTLPELSPITSLTELKYACDKNGLFFKLDLDTGILAPINVCIKKNAKVKPRVYQKVSQCTLLPKSVIDLTNDGEREIAKNVTEDGTIKPIKLINLSEDEPVKPIRLVKRKTYSPNLLMRKTSAQQSIILQDTRRNESNKRKQNLEKIEAKIDLVDSDAPIEEEYLVDSSESEDDERQNPTKKIRLPDVESDDSSDEEPLATKFMRLKQNKAQEQVKKCETTQQTTDFEDKIPIAATVATTPTAVPVLMDSSKPTEVVSENFTEDVNLNAMEVSENAIEDINPDTSMEIEEPEFLPLLCENESQEEDCILGV